MTRLSILTLSTALILTAAPALAQGAPNFGDNSSRWSNDGECDDPRFQNAPGGYGMAQTLLDEDLAKDANDCRSLYNAGAIQLRAGGRGGRNRRNAGGSCGNGNFQFGDNSSRWANDGECDDPRFQNAPGGYGMAQTLLGEDAFHDANDCRSLCNTGAIRPRRR